MFESTFENIEKQYVFRSLRVGKHGFRFSEMALWASTTRKKIEQDINVLQKFFFIIFRPFDGLIILTFP